MSRLWTFEKASEFVKSESKGVCELLSIDKKNGRDYMNVKCGCGNTFEVKYYHFKDGKHTCNICSGKARYSITEIKEHVESNSDCVLLSEKYTNNTNLLEFRCSCNRKFKTTLKIFNKGKKQCETCMNKQRAVFFSKPHEEFVKEVYRIVGDEYSVIGEYKNAKTKIEIKHNTCGCEWFVNSSDFLHKDSRCPKCNESKGERSISDWLIENRVSFEQQYTFYDCRNKRKLPFDFAVFKNEKLSYLIEYDGKQHYLRGCFGIDTFDEIKKNDQIKNQYCREKGIQLLRIPYTKFKQIPTILQNTLL